MAVGANLFNEGLEHENVQHLPAKPEGNVKAAD